MADFSMIDLPIPRFSKDLKWCGGLCKTCRHNEYDTSKFQVSSEVLKVAEVKEALHSVRTPEVCYVINRKMEEEHWKRKKKKRERKRKKKKDIDIHKEMAELYMKNVLSPDTAENSLFLKYDYIRDVAKDKLNYLVLTLLHDKFCLAVGKKVITWPYVADEETIGSIDYIEDVLKSVEREEIPYYFFDIVKNVSEIIDGEKVDVNGVAREQESKKIDGEKVDVNGVAREQESKKIDPRDFLYNYHVILEIEKYEEDYKTYEIRKRSRRREFPVFSSFLLLKPTMNTCQSLSSFLQEKHERFEDVPVLKFESFVFSRMSRTLYLDADEAAFSAVHAYSSIYGNAFVSRKRNINFNRKLGLSVEQREKVEDKLNENFDDLKSVVFTPIENFAQTLGDKYPSFSFQDISETLKSYLSSRKIPIQDLEDINLVEVFYFHQIPNKKNAENKSIEDKYKLLVYLKQGVYLTFLKMLDASVPDKDMNPKLIETQLYRVGYRDELDRYIFQVAKVLSYRFYIGLLVEHESTFNNMKTLTTIFYFEDRIRDFLTEYIAVERDTKVTDDAKFRVVKNSCDCDRDSEEELEELLRKTCEIKILDTIFHKDIYDNKAKAEEESKRKATHPVKRTEDISDAKAKEKSKMKPLHLVKRTGDISDAKAEEKSKMKPTLLVKRTEDISYVEEIKKTRKRRRSSKDFEEFKMTLRRTRSSKDDEAKAEEKSKMKPSHLVQRTEDISDAKADEKSKRKPSLLLQRTADISDAKAELKSKMKPSHHVQRTEDISDVGESEKTSVIEKSPKNDCRSTSEIMECNGHERSDNHVQVEESDKTPIIQESPKDDVRITSDIMECGGHEGGDNHVQVEESQKTPVIEESPKGDRRITSEVSECDGQVGGDNQVQVKESKKTPVIEESLKDDCRITLQKMISEITECDGHEGGDNQVQVEESKKTPVIKESLKDDCRITFQRLIAKITECDGQEGGDNQVQEESDENKMLSEASEESYDEESDENEMLSGASEESYDEESCKNEILSEASEESYDEESGGNEMHSESSEGSYDEEIDENEMYLESSEESYDEESDEYETSSESSEESYDEEDEDEEEGVDEEEVVDEEEAEDEEEGGDEKKDKDVKKDKDEGEAENDDYIEAFHNYSETMQMFLRNYEDDYSDEEEDEGEGYERGEREEYDWPKYPSENYKIVNELDDGNEDDLIAQLSELHGRSSNVKKVIEGESIGKKKKASSSEETGEFLSSNVNFDKPGPSREGDKCAKTRALRGLGPREEKEGKAKSSEYSLENIEMLSTSYEETSNDKRKQVPQSERRIHTSPERFMREKSMVEIMQSALTPKRKKMNFMLRQSSYKEQYGKACLSRDRNIRLLSIGNKIQAKTEQKSIVGSDSKSKTTISPKAKTEQKSTVGSDSKSKTTISPKGILKRTPKPLSESDRKISKKSVRFMTKSGPLETKFEKKAAAFKAGEIQSCQSANAADAIIPPPPTLMAGKIQSGQSASAAKPAGAIIPPPPTLMAGKLQSGQFANAANPAGATIPPPPTLMAGKIQSGQSASAAKPAGATIPPPPTLMAGKLQSDQFANAAKPTGATIPPPPTLMTGKIQSGQSANASKPAGATIPPSSNLMGEDEDFFLLSSKSRLKENLTFEDDETIYLFEAHPFEYSESKKSIGQISSKKRIIPYPSLKSVFNLEEFSDIKEMNFKSFSDKDCQTLKDFLKKF